MSLAASRTAIARYFQSSWIYEIPMGHDGHPFTPAHRSVRLTIKDGARLQGSIGRVQNSVYTIGVIMAQVYTTGGAGTDAWRVIGDLLIDLTHEIALDEDGIVVIGSDQTTLVRFSPPELGGSAHPYIADDTDGVPFRQSTINIPFVAYELR